LQPDGMLALMKWDEETPYIFFFKHGLDEEKVVSTGVSLLMNCFNRINMVAAVYVRMLRGSETWPVRKENRMVLQLAELRMGRWMCGVKLKDSVLNKELIERNR